MGAVYSMTGSYLIGLMLLTVVSATALWHSLRRFGLGPLTAPSA
jgi:hypothetical protein